jgi:hypothetical protein
MSPTNRNTLGLRANTRLAGYAALAGAALAAPVVADASIIYSGPVNITIQSTTNGLYLNVVNGAINEPGNTTGSSVPGWDVNPFSSSGLSFFNPTAPAGSVYVQRTGGGATANLPFGTLIDATSVYGSSAAATTGAQPFVLSSSNNIVGFRFQNEAAGNAIEYGWMRISLSTTLVGQPRAIVEYAYEDSGAGINAGAVPEPSTFALLGVMAAGALGVREWRKRKAA